MAKKEISIVLRAKNSMAAGLAKARDSVAKFGKSAMRIGGLFAKAFLAAGIAVAGFAAKAIAAYAVQETAERSLIAAMNAHGEAGEALIPSLKRVAAAIQDETGAADESTLAGMAKMRMLGVQTAKLGEAAKGVIALKAVGLQEEAAQKAVAMAMQGSYDMLNRYLPALRMTKDETEKANIVNEFFAKGYDQQTEVLDTVGGQWKVLQGRIGDVWEEIGAAIMQNEGLMVSLTKAGEAVKEFGNKVSAWVEGGGVIRLVAGFKLFYADVSRQFRLIGNSAVIMWESLVDGGKTTFDYLKTVTDAWTLAFYEDLKSLGAQWAAIYKKIKGGKFEAPDTSAYEKAMEDLARARSGVDIKASAELVAAYADRLKIEDDYAADVAKITAEQAAAQTAHVDELAEKRKKEAEAEKKAAEAATAVVKKETDKQKKAKLKLLKDELSVIKKQKAAVEELAKSRVQAVIDAARAAKDEAKSRAKDEAKAGELAEREKRGTRLSRKDKEFLDAYNKIEMAKAKTAKLEAAGKSVEGKIAAAEKALKVQEGIKADLDVIKEQNAKLLTYSGG